MALTTDMEDALEAAAITHVTLVKVELRSGPTITWMDGSGFVVFGGDTYVGTDEVFGALSTVESLTDGIDAEAPRWRFTFSPPDMAGVLAFVDPENQGSPVYVWEGLIDKTTGLIVPDPDPAFDGFIDVPVFNPRSRGVVVDCACVWELLFDDDEGANLSDSFHQSVRAGELGFEFMSAVQRQLPWGIDAPRPGVVSDVTQADTRSILQGYLDNNIF